MAEVVDLKRREEPTGPFVVGSTVKLRSGGASMTVRKPGKLSVTVDWTNSSDDICREDFPAAMLCHSDPDKVDDKKDESAK